MTALVDTVIEVLKHLLPVGLGEPRTVARAMALL